MVRPIANARLAAARYQVLERNWAMWLEAAKEFAFRMFDRPIEPGVRLTQGGGVTNRRWRTYRCGLTYLTKLATHRQLHENDTVTMTIAGYEISTDATRLDHEMIFRFLSEDSYWAAGIPRAVVEKSIANSLCFGVYDAAAQVGLARVVTDRATFALVADVFILEAHRGKGLSKWLMHEVTQHPDLSGLRRLLLLTSDAHSLYAQFGFTELGNARRFMEVLRPDVYKPS